MIPYYTIGMLMGLGMIFLDGTRKYIDKIALRKKGKGYDLLYVICCICLIFLLAFRNDNSADYANYILIYHKAGTDSWANLFAHFKDLRIELGFRVLAKIIYTMSYRENHLQFFFVVAVLSLVPVFAIIYKYSEMPFMSLFLFFIIGFYFNAFNTMRSCMVCGLSSLAVPCYFRREYKKIIFLSLVLYMFHTLGVFLIPIYLVINEHILKGRKMLYALAGAFALFAFSDEVIALTNKIFFQSYFSHALSAGFFRPGPFGSTVPAIAILCALIMFRKDTVGNSHELIITNGTFLWAVCKLFTLIIEVASRYSDLLCIFPALYVPIMINRVTEKKFFMSNRILLNVGVNMAVTYVFFIWLWFMMRQSPFNPYYTIWSN